MLEGVPSTTTSSKRKRGFLLGLENYKSIKVIAKVADYSRAKAMMAVGSVLNDGLEFDGIYAHNDAMAAGARIALKKQGINPGSIPTVGIDFLNETRDAIRKGEQLASFTYPTCGKVGVAMALKILRGKKVQRFISVPYQMVTKANVDTIEPVFE